MNKITKSTTNKALKLNDLHHAQDEIIVSLFNDYKQVVVMLMEQLLAWHVNFLVGERYEHQWTERKYYRHGENPSSLRVGSEKVRIKVPRIRNIDTEECSIPPIWSKVIPDDIFAAGNPCKVIRILK
jgi:hypothetical protein